MKSRLACLALAALLAGCATIAPEKRIPEPLKSEHRINDPQIERSLGHLLCAPFVDGNQVQVLLNGDETFPAMLEAIRAAKKSVTLEENIFVSGRVVTSFIEALTERARAGVKVHLILDAFGSRKLSREDLKTLRDDGVDVAYFNPPHLLRLHKFHHRTHRKLLVVDGKIGFCGGVCIEDHWAGNAEPGQWRDTHFRVEGPVVSQIQAVFAENWLQVRSEVLHGEDYFPELPAKGGVRAQFFRSGARDGAENARTSYLLAIASARENIRLAHSYFLPNKVLVDALLAARKRGVTVEVILPEKSDNYLVQRAARSRWGELLEGGVEFYQYEPTTFHCKIMIVDDLWVTAGSVNFGERSFKVDDEANLNALSADLARRLIESYDADKAKSRRLDVKDFKRNWFGRALDHFFGLFRSQM